MGGLPDLGFNKRPGGTSTDSVVGAGIGAVGVAWFILGLFFPPLLTALGYVVFTPIHAAFGIVFGVIFGAIQGAQAIATVATLMLTYPTAWSALSGILAGCIVAWIYTTFGVKEKLSSPGISAIFSVDPIRHGG